MRYAGLSALVLEVIVFLLLSARCGWELLSPWPQCFRLLDRLGRPSGAQGAAHERVPTESESLSGVGARRSVQGMLGIACIARAGLTLFILVRGNWVPYLAVPDLAYLATYGALVVFLAQMQQIHVGYRYAWIKVAAWTALATVLVVSLIVCTVRWGTNPLSHRSLLLRKFLYYELGLTYLLMFAGFVYFGVRVCVTAYHNKRLFYRILTLTTVCGVALLSKGAFFVAAAANAWRTDALFPTSTGRYRFEALIALEELLPSLAILALTSRGRGGRACAPNTSEVAGFSRYNNSPFFNLNSANSPGPPISAGPYGYGSVVGNP